MLNHIFVDSTLENMIKAIMKKCENDLSAP